MRHYSNFYMHSWIYPAVRATLKSSFVLPKWHARAQTIQNRTPTRGQRRGKNYLTWRLIILAHLLVFARIV